MCTETRAATANICLRSVKSTVSVKVQACAGTCVVDRLAILSIIKQPTTTSKIYNENLPDQDLMTDSKGNSWKIVCVLSCLVFYMSISRSAKV